MVMRLLESTLSRSANSSLFLTVANDADESFHVPAIELMGPAFAAVADGHIYLPHLEINCWGTSDDATSVSEFFRTASRLKGLQFMGNLETIGTVPHIPFHQLEGFQCIETLDRDLPVVTSLLLRLSPKTEVALHLRLEVSSRRSRGTQHRLSYSFDDI
ncbi:hypothetical protein C8R43DRAFT_1131282 [Mycena crocata]|nr:hypothetical protein C8R43DRAFT_1131282 [Mycena crocata]